ncbi:MAG: 50S ribosomal protein L10 [Proteobacteria bacterium]|nr:50S ribosomal protein L10 [Pseudomonadota bacterium]MDA1012642.1 50S ribosomal protein L10 [Pseudomonadota bacterium]
MSLNRKQKEAVIGEISEKLSDAQSVVLAEYRGLTVGEMTQLRVNARSSGVYLRVLKNTLAKLAVKGTPFEGLSGDMVGPLAYGISSDPVAAAKVLSDFSKTNDKFLIKVGAMPNQVMSAADVSVLAKMPSRDELLSKLLGTMQAPIAKFVQTLNEVPTKFVRGIAAVRDLKEQEAA